MKTASIILMLILPISLLISFLKGLLGLENPVVSQMAVILTMIGLPALVLGVVLFFVSKSQTTASTK
jgi:hypothetical protein